MQYLDERIEVWLSEGTALRTGNGTTNCISCHTTLPYALARPTLRRAMGVEAPTPLENRVLDQIVRRVETYGDQELMYEFNEAKKAESLGTEAVLNLLILTSADGRAGASDSTVQAALEQLWRTQRQDGSWNWLEFGLEPFETKESMYQGAAWAAMAVGELAPDAAATDPAFGQGVQKLRGYLNATFEQRSLFNRTWALLASTRLEGLLSDTQRDGLLLELEQQQRADGGWSLSTLGEWRWSASEAPFTPPGDVDPALLARSDGFATGLVTYALQEAGLPLSHPTVERGVAWLLANQKPVLPAENAPAAWRAHSLNFDRENGGPRGETTPRLFMSDLATSFAVLALAGSD